MAHNAENLRRLLGIALLLAISGVGLNCSHSRQQAASDDQKKPEPVSETAPRFEPMRRTAPVVTSTEPVASVGDCAPKYANGLHGSCINNQPCRGFGALDEKGKAVCSCYAKAGGCGERERCDAIKKACVPEKEPGFGRAPED
jgi:hypothetical protein